MWSARSALFRLLVWCTRSGVFVFFTKEEGEGEVQKRSLNPFPEKEKRRRDESQKESETFVVDFVVCLFFWASRPLRKIQIVWPHFILLFVRMDQHPPPPPQ